MYLPCLGQNKDVYCFSIWSHFLSNDRVVALILESPVLQSHTFALTQSWGSFLAVILYMRVIVLEGDRDYCRAKIQVRAKQTPCILLLRHVER